MVWLRDYLNLTQTCPTWAYITDILINKMTLLSLDKHTRANAFLQNWKILTKGKRVDRLGDDTLRMMKAANKHNVEFTPINISQDLRESLPAWQHLGIEKQPPRNLRSLCLARIHKSKKVKDMLKVTDRLKGTYRGGIHTPVFSCHCDDCKTGRSHGCENPQHCAIEAQKRLGWITPKLNPTRLSSQDSLSLTKCWRERNQQAAEDNEQGVIFDPSVMEKKDLSECFRVFMDPKKIRNIPAKRHMCPNGISLDNEEITDYTDGSCLNNRKQNARCGGGIWLEDGSQHNRILRIPGLNQSNQVGEIAVVVIALEKLPNYIPLLIKMDSRYVIEGLTMHLKKWEDQGWIGIKNKEWFKRAAYLLRQ